MQVLSQNVKKLYKPSLKLNTAILL